MLMIHHYLLAKKESLYNVLTEINAFGNVAGPVLNKDKTVLKWLGNPQEKWNISVYDMEWTERPVKYLGVYVGLETEITDLNWKNKIKNMNVLVNNWKKRNLTLFGKVLIIKTLLVSQIIHLLMFCPISDIIIKQINKIIYNFLWNAKVDKVARNKVVKS